jgi:uncharacterized membrane-anchored protein YhcB (DUF1043 family)
MSWTDMLCWLLQAFVVVLVLGPLAALLLNAAYKAAQRTIGDLEAKIRRLEERVDELEKEGR